jgi:hypothetical protein
MSCSFLQLNKENRTWRADLVHEDNQELESVARKTTPAAALSLRWGSFMAILAPARSIR